MGKELGSKIDELLSKRGMSQHALATRINITDAQLSRYISGDRDPKPETLANIATALETTSDYLLGIENDEFNLYSIKRMIARNSEKMTNEEKKALMAAIFGED